MFDFDPKELAKAYGDAEGPLGFPMPSEKATLLEKALKEQPEDCRTSFEVDGTEGYLRKALVSDNQDVDDKERTDKAIITNTVLDRYQHVVDPDGVDTAAFSANAQVPFEHMYKALPVGRSLWASRQKSRTPEKNGIVARTLYHTHDFANSVWELVKSGAMPAKSVGLLPMSMRRLNEKDIKSRPELAEHAAETIVIDKSVLLEYSVAVIPVNPTTLTISIQKSLGVKGMLDTVEMIRKAGVMIPKSALDEIKKTEGETPSDPKEELIILATYEPVDIQAEVDKAVRREFARRTGKMF